MNPNNASHATAPSITGCDSRDEILAALLPTYGVFDTRDLLDSHPDMCNDKSIVLDVIYEEYCRRKSAGETVDPNAFCGKFPNYQASVGRLLQVSDFVEDDFSFVGPEDFLGFKLRRQLGQGRFARVFLATETELGDRQVAVKISRHGSVEARTLGRLKHPNIIEIYSVQNDPDTGLSVVCMPYLGNATLLDVLDRLYAAPAPPKDADLFTEVIAECTAHVDPVQNPLAADPHMGRGSYVTAVARLGAQLADALQFVHARGVFHQDVKPSNVLLAAGGRPVLLDFNLSIDGRFSDRLRGGTPTYMAPEQLRLLRRKALAECATADPRSDVYALGLVLYELLAGQHPFGPIRQMPPLEIADVLLSRMTVPVTPLRTRNPRVGRKLARIVERCLDSRIDARPQSAAAVAAALRASVPIHHRLRQLVVTHPIRATLTSIGAAVLLTGSTAWGIYAIRPAGADAAEAMHLPATPAECLEHAKELQRTGRYEEAIKYYGEAGDLATGGLMRSCLGYCLSRCNFHRQAAYRFQEAIATGENTSALWNNYGQNLMVVKPSDQPWMELAYAAFSRAIQLEPTCQTPYYNRALLLFEMVRLRLGAPNIAGIRSEDEAASRALLDIREALRIGPPTAELFLDAARIAAAVAPPNTISTDQHARVEALQFLQQAIELGIDPGDRGLATDLALTRHLGKDPLFAKLIHSPRSGRMPERTDRLIDPVQQ